MRLSMDKTLVKSQSKGLRTYIVYLSPCFLSPRPWKTIAPLSMLSKVWDMPSLKQLKCTINE